MKKALLWAVILSLALILVSCTSPDCELPTTETTIPETTGGCNGDCTTHVIVEYDEITAPPSDEETIEFDVFPPVPTETENPIATNSFSAPSDEQKVSKVYYASTVNGPTMKIILYGYKSDMLGESLYFKNNEPIEMKVVIKNRTEAPIYQWQPSMCHGMTPSHEHELSVSFSDANGNKLTNARLDFFYFFMACPQAIEIWSLAPGESYEWNLSYLVGTAKESVIWKDPICDTEFSVNFDLYDEEIFTDGVCTFEGSIDFAFRYTADDDEYGNTETLSIPLSLKVFYVGE